MKTLKRVEVYANTFISTRGDFERSCESKHSRQLLIVNGDPAGARTQDPRLKRASRAVTTEDDRVRPIYTIPLKSCNISFMPV